MGINATFTKNITVTEVEQELTPETFAQDGMSAMCIFDAFRLGVAVPNLLIRFNTTDDWYVWPTTEWLWPRTESIYVKLSAVGSVSASMLARIQGIRMTTLPKTP